MEFLRDNLVNIRQVKAELNGGFLAVLWAFDNFAGFSLAEILLVLLDLVHHAFKKHEGVLFVGVLWIRVVIIIISSS